MTTYQSSSNNIHALEEYIDIDISPSANFICSPSDNRDFEFQMSSISQDKKSIISPADELFYKGKLLPLHIPLRLEMVRKILQVSNAALDNNISRVPFEETVPISSISSSKILSADNARISAQSCNTYPSVSCRFASELNRDGPNKYFFPSTNENDISIYDKPKVSWSNKQKKSSIGQLLKASQTYLKFLFTKSACSSEHSAKATCNHDPKKLLKTQEPSRKLKKTEERASFSGKIDCGRIKKLASLTKNLEKEVHEDSASILNPRRSFSGISHRMHSASRCSFSSSSRSSSSSSSSISVTPHEIYDLQLLRNISSGDAETEISISEAITHCKRSQRLLSPRKTSSEFTHCNLSPRISNFRCQN